MAVISPDAPSPRTIQGYGWSPDLPDRRDHRYATPATVLDALPRKADTTTDDAYPPCYDQLSIGTCVDNSIAGAVQYDQKRQGLPVFMPSRLFLYYNARAIEGSLGQDSGSSIRDGMRVVASQGVCSENLWPYDIGAYNQRPPEEAYTTAAMHTATSYARVGQSLTEMQGCLAHGYPFVAGFTVYESFESDAVARTGHLLMPGPTEKVRGGHAILVVGYDMDTQEFKIRNSWGPDWGLNGYFYMPFAYLMDPNLSDDFWMVKMVS